VYRAQLALFGKLFSGVRRGGSAAHFPRSFDHERDAEGFCQGALLVRSIEGTVEEVESLARSCVNLQGVQVNVYLVHILVVHEAECFQRAHVLLPLSIFGEEAETRSV